MYHYIVRAVDPSNDVEDTNTVERSGVPTGPLLVGTWTDDAGDTGAAKLVLDAPWSVSATGGHAGPAVYQTGLYAADLCAAAVTPPLLLSSGAELAFWSRYDIDYLDDKGEVQVSTDGGVSWSRVQVNYPGYAISTSDGCDLPSGFYFSGTDDTYLQYTGSLEAWAGQDVLVRWVLSSTSWGSGDGWWIDDISITNVAVPDTCRTEGERLFADGFESGDTAAWSQTVPWS
jgi:hypothetical protein